MEEDQWGVSEKRIQGNLSRNQDMNMNQKQSVPVKISAPNLKNCVKKQIITVRSNKEEVCRLQQEISRAVRSVR